MIFLLLTPLVKAYKGDVAAAGADASRGAFSTRQRWARPIRVLIAGLEPSVMM